jgi:hypothetical protein
MRAGRAALAARLLAVAAVLAAGAAGIGLAEPAGARAAPGAEEHCVLRVVGQDPATGELQTGPMTCASTRSAALQRSGAELAADDWPIGIHFDGLSLTGSSLTVVGNSCIGGWLNVPAAWNNRISSTWNGCPRIRHYDGANLVVPEQTVLAPGGNLLSLDNKTSSIQYLT